MAKMIPINQTPSTAKILHFRKKKIKRTASRIIICLWVIQTIATVYFLTKGHI